MFGAVDTEPAADLHHFQAVYPGEFHGVYAPAQAAGIDMFGAVGGYAHDNQGGQGGDQHEEYHGATSQVLRFDQF